jgi:hypothetical protein
MIAGEPFELDDDKELKGESLGVTSVEESFRGKFGAMDPLGVVGGVVVECLRDFLRSLWLSISLYPFRFSSFVLTIKASRIKQVTKQNSQKMHTSLFRQAASLNCPLHRPHA